VPCSRRPYATYGPAFVCTRRSSRTDAATLLWTDLVMMHPRYVLLAAALLAACGSEPSGDAVGRSVPDSAAATAAPDSVPQDAGPARGAPAITLAADGLELSGGGGAPRRLAFGAPRARVLADVGAVLGEPREQGMQEECPAGPLYQASYAGGLQLSFQDSAFVGWFAQEGSALRTAPGVGPGSTLGELKAAYPATKVEETSLGHEFDAGELWGIVTDTTGAGQVQVMFAGINCIFR